MSSIPESSNITSDNRTNSVIVSLPGKQYFKSISVIISLALLKSAMLKGENSIVKVYYLRKHSSFSSGISLSFS